MGRFDDTGIDDYKAQSKNPAAPAGLQQQAATNANRFDQGSAQLQAWQPINHVDEAQGWYTGANQNGTTSGWSNEFVEKFQSGWNQALQDGTARNYFENGGTGVVTWDHLSDDTTRTYKFGDVYEDGKKVGNIYDQFDRNTANLMMLPWLDADGKAQARIFAADTDEQRMADLDRFVTEAQGTAEKNFTDWTEATEFQNDVKDTAAGISGGEIAAGGAAGGGALGAGIGSFFGGVGAVPGYLVGAGIGAAAGAFTSWLNKDELAEQSARAYEITKLSYEDNGAVAGTFTALSQGAGLTQKFTSPLTNLAHGATDRAIGEAGDGVTERYRLDEHGRSTAPAWSKVADWTAMVGDGLLQFASPLNRAVYTAQMSGQIGGEVGELTATGGKMFDPREGGYDNIFVDDNGHADPVSGAAGILKIGIDAVQLAGWRGFARTAAADRAALEAGTRPVEMAGMRFTFDEAGNVAGRSKTLALLAPSEQIAYQSAARAARVTAMKEGRAVTADDFYRAASSLHNGSNRLKAAMVNAIGEGYEEAAQAVLEPMALDGQMSFRDVASSFFYGAAAGVGMSMGATVGGSSRDERMRNQAYFIETIRRGEEPDPAEFDAAWERMSEAEKRVLAARSPETAALAKAALDRDAKQQMATMTASDVDAAKAIDARRSMIDRDLKSGSSKTDQFQVMAGQLDAGRVSQYGTLLGDTAHPESAEFSALGVHRMLENRLKGLGLQEQYLTQEIAKLDPADPRVAELQQTLSVVSLARAFGEGFTTDIGTIVNRIHDEATDEAQARSLTRQLNGLIQAVYERRAPLNPIEGITATDEQLADAAAQFVTLLSAREPKLDAGSYPAFMPRASWILTRDRADNFVQVNTDILQSINGDFDGDKLRAENQLVLSPERYLQVRGGQFLGGAGRALDIGTRNFDVALAADLARGLKSEPGSLKDEADATMAAIETAITNRYGKLMSPDALRRVLDDFRTAVHAGSEEARVTLLNGLATEAGEAITNLGRASLRNEWLWASKVVRANLQAFQTSYRKAAATSGPSATADVADLDTDKGTNRRKDVAVNDAQTLALFAVGNTLFRKFQKIHYTFFNSRALEAAQAEPADLYEMARTYEELGRGVSRDELSRVLTDDTVAGRVLVMLQRVVDSALDDPALAGKFTPGGAMSILANVKVKDVQFVSGEPMLVDGGADISLVQLLLKRALDADREEHARTFATDEKLQAKHARLRALTVPNSVNGDVNAEKAFLEVFGSTPFADAMGGVTGALAPHTTPQQWLRNYISLDETGRQDMERLFKNVPEYLDRKERSNLPYSFDEAARREVTAYRSMMDAMIAVGRAFPVDAKKVSDLAANDFAEAHALVRQAMVDYRKAANRRSGDRKITAEMVQEMFAANPARGREVLDLIPNAAANAVFEYRDNQLYVAPWVYEMFAIEDSVEATFFYWKNLTLAQWNSTLLKVRESDGTAEGRKYRDLQSRFQRLLYRLAKEPGQYRLEQVILKMDEAKSLEEFFDWLNSAPGIRRLGQEAAFLPFNDDVADFEADAGGGWVTVKAGSDLRAAIAKLRRGAETLRQTMSFREEKAATDRVILDGIKRALSGDPTATPLDKENLRKLRRAVEVSRSLPRGFAPSAMLALTQGAVRGFDAHAHDKGVTITWAEPLGEFQALMDAFAFVPGLERVMETLTAHSIGSLRTNVGDLAKHAGAAMDANGRQIEWAPLTVEQAVEMLDDSRTAPLAHALLTPAALDLTPVGLSERLLMEASLKDLLDDAHYKELFRENPQNQLDQALRYLSLVDAKARAEGGSFDAVRIANRWAIARTSGLGRPATEDDLARLRDQAYIELARVLKMVGQIQATPDARDADTLALLRDTALQSLNQHRLAKALPGFTDKTTGEVVETWVESVLNDLEAEKTELLSTLADLYDGAELDAHTEALEAQYERNAERIRGMLEDNLAQATVSRFAVTGDPNVDRAAHAQIVEYVRSMAGFPNRAPEAAQAWGKLARQLQAGTSPDLSKSEWETLAAASMGVYMSDQLLRVAGHVTLPPFPQGDPAVSDARFYKFFDPAFAFMVSDVLDESAPLTKAAVWLHTMAEQPRTVMSVDAMTRVLNTTVLDRTKLGTWTPGLMSQLVEAEQRMDSAAAGQAIAAAGNGPKRWAAIAAATRRDGTVPDASLLTTATFTADLLAPNASRFNELLVIPAGAVDPQAMPVAMLDNRFFSAIRINGVEIPLDADNLGYAWDGAAGPNPYRYVSLERLRPVVDRYVATNKLKPSQVNIEVEFFHPDSQPAELMNNAFFEGMGHSLLPDGAESLLATLWSDNGGQIAADTQRPLDAGKKGKKAIQPFRRLDPVTVAEADALWSRDHDFAAMLRRKTELILGYDDGSGAADPANFNALYKTMKLQHIVVGRDADGNAAALTAEQVIAHQAANGKAADLPLVDAKLVKLSPDVLRTMLGETGDQGVNRFFDDPYLVNPADVAAYTGITRGMLDRFGDGWLAETGSPADTSLAHVGQQKVLTVRTILTDAERNTRQERIAYLDNRSGEVRAARYSKLKGTEAYDSYVAALQLAAGAVAAERVTFDFGAVNSGLIAPRNVVEAEHTGRLLEAMKGIADANAYQRGFQVKDEGGPDYPGGVLTVDSLDGQRELEHHVVKDDLAVVLLNTFERPERTIDVVEDRVEKALRYLANTGAHIALGSGNGGGDLRYHASEYLRSLGYAPVAGSRHLYAPVEFSFQTQNERAYESTLLETDLIRPARNVVTFLATDPIGADENVAILNQYSAKLRDRTVLSNILPSSAYPNYNIPLDDNLDTGLYARTLTHLRTMLDPKNTDARATLLTMGGRDPERVMPLAQALDRFHAKITNSASLLPEVGSTLEVGDIVPFVHPDGKVILYRHGFKLPEPNEVAALQSLDGMNIALAASQTEPAATANSGVIRAVENRAGYGRSLVLEAPLQPYGNKIQLEWNGMKYVVAPAPEGMEIPTLFANGTVVDLISDAASADSKEAFAGRVFGYRNALAFFQFDFTDDLTEFFFPGQNTAENRMLTINLLHRLANQNDSRIPYADANAIAKANVAVADLLAEFAGAEADRGGPATDWIGRLSTGVDPSALIAQSVITYLLTPGAHVENVLRSSGFSHPRAGEDTVQTRRVPGLFADLLDHGLDSPLHAELIRRFDGQLLRGPNGEGFKLHADWTAEMFDSQGGSIRGYLQFGEAHSSGDNPLLDGQAFDINDKQAVSPHNTMASFLSAGTRTAHKTLAKSTAFARSFGKGQGVVKDGESMWQMLTALPNEKDHGLAGGRMETPAETMRRAVAREEIVGLYQPLTTEDWTEAEQREYQTAAEQVLGQLNLYGSQRAMVDTWVRMHLGRPHDIDEAGTVRGVISAADAIETVKEIRSEVRKGNLPVAGANIPLIDVNHLTTMYLRNAHREDGWHPVDPATGQKVTSWDGWVEMALGTAFNPDARFDQVYLLAVDGLMHGYQGATTSTRYLPVSSDVLRNKLLMDRETNRMLVSISADENLLATDPTLFNAQRAELEEIIGGQRIYADGRDGADPESAKGKQRRRLKEWRREAEAPEQVLKKMRGVRGSGQSFAGHSTTTSAMFRGMLNIRAGNTLWNPALWLSAPVDAWHRRTIDAAADFLVGEGAGKLGEAQAKLVEKMGGRLTYSPEEHKQLNTLVDALSQRSEFKAMVFKELVYQYPTMPGIGRLGKLLEQYAKAGARLQDPTWGMLPKDIARIYVKTVMRRIAADPTGDNVYSVERLLTEMRRNPEWLMKADLETHNMAIAAIAQIRSLKPNVLSLGFRGVVEPLSENPRWVFNATGNMVKVLTLFQNFWANFGTTITGLQGPVDFMAFMLDGRKKKITARMQHALRGDQGPFEDEFFDMSEVLESLDLADSFIRGGVTHAGLFALGMLAGGLGLSGEDDEMKFRRRQAELQGVPVIRDPRDVENDFRNKDAIFLDWLPLGLDSFFRMDPNDPDSRSLAQMNWIARTFLSPVIGFERFYETGDFAEVIHGFKDAIGSHPIINQELWNEATDTVASLHEQANGQIEAGDVAGGGHTLITAVMVMERMLFENSAVNLVYTGMDEWDRDPYVLPLRDSDGELQKDISGQTRPNNLALQYYVDPDTNEIAQGYLGRSQGSTDRHVLTENRATMAFISSLFTGGIDDSDYWRYNMPIKTRSIENTALTQEQAEAAIKQLMVQSGDAQARLTPDEIEYIAKGNAMRNKDWNAYNHLDEIVKHYTPMFSAPSPLSVLDEHGREVLTQAGAEGVFRGLRKGSVTLDADSLRGLFIPPEMREAIQEKWAKELVAEGLELGLDQTKAASRAKRILYGSFDDPGAKGLADILWAKPEDGGIAYEPAQVYKQLNTTYITGPDGLPWATGFGRQKLLGALGLTPLTRMLQPQGSRTGMDGRGNTTDLVNGRNTGLRGLVPLNKTEYVPTDVEIGKMLEDALGKAQAATSGYTPYDNKSSGSGSGWKNYGGYRRRYGGGGYGGGGGGAYFVRMNTMPRNIAPYGNSAAFINTSNPIIRRAFVRRERVSSERGRLNQWQ